jgi:hypothetical protein
LVSSLCCFKCNSYRYTSGRGAAAQIKREEKSKKSGKGAGKKGKDGKVAGGKRGARKDAMTNVRTYAAPSGRDILVGRNSKGNEAVSLQIGGAVQAESSLHIARKRPVSTIEPIK